MKTIHTILISFLVGLLIGLYFCSLSISKYENRQEAILRLPADTSSYSLLYLGNVTVTVFNANATQCDDDYLNTAFGYKIDKKINQHFVAVSRDLKWLKHKTIFLSNCDYLSGYYTVVDLCNDRFTKRVDILVHDSITTGKYKGQLWINKY